MNADTGEFVPNEDLGPNWVFLAKLWSFLTTKNPLFRALNKTITRVSFSFQC